MFWWFTTFVLFLVLGLLAGFVLQVRQQRARFLASERRRLAAEVESDRLRLGIEVLQRDGVRAAHLESEVAVLQASRVDLEERNAELSIARAEIERLINSVVALTVEASRTGPLGLELARSRNNLAETEELIGRLHRELAAVQVHRSATHEIARPRPELVLPSDQLPSWVDGVTQLGTPGANHYDDLKEIRGIGPVMERTLNSFGIHTWEQIATLTGTDIEKLSAALQTFPDRIRRDNWIGGARKLLVAGHGQRRPRSILPAPA